MKIYRLETKDGRGVYGAAIFILNLIEDYLGGDVTPHPGPQRDTLFCENHQKKLGLDLSTTYAFSGKYVFGFSSPNQVLRWFFNRGDLETLESECGIQLSVYECDDVIVGNTQVAFGIWHHTLFNPVAIYGLTEFYDLFAGKSPSI